ncbi:hypothetical protein PLESTB_000500200 [Pleodorina starrii]|uniref:Rhodanese domain-containing protein n=1 Tax=Pleodorina starrii TaxID=330485 RepID=A0A9W6EZU1_9CHLO|nr:hypothetical protein PLESTM_000371600 [Pleodorina starrii]GLC51418.1 hypothetical protein PLESTB_000500200 [Pleodorina starrii]GLC63783.1 hypothetical protein PLESTF_000073700 [Pleodorina starrii]
MSSCALHTSGLSLAGRLSSARGQRKAIAVPEGPKSTVQATASLQSRGQLGRRQVSVRPLRVAEVVRPVDEAEERPTEERFLDVHAILSDFNPLKESHLLRWEDSDDEDGAVQAELPVAGAWEDDSSGYQGLEYQPSWIDYRDGSESDDPEALRGAPGAYKALAAVMPELGEDIDSQSMGTLQAGGLPGAPAPSAYSPEAGFQEISVVELEERLATGQFSLLLDVRSPPEYDSGHIAGATNLPLDPDLSAAVRGGSLDEFRERPIAVVCGSGMRSGQATVRLTKVFGFTNVTNVTGGMRAWASEGLPVQGQPVRSGGGCGCGGGGGGGGGCKSKQAD